MQQFTYRGHNFSSTPSCNNLVNEICIQLIDEPSDSGNQYIFEEQKFYDANILLNLVAQQENVQFFIPETVFN
jgi:hypothetical protein